MKTRDIILWAGAISLVFIGMVVTIVMSSPSEASVSAVAESIQSAPVINWNSAAVRSIDQRDSNGTLPVGVITVNPPRVDPFQ